MSRKNDATDIEYVCPKCGADMVFDDAPWDYVLICPECGHNMEVDEYGMGEEEYRFIYPPQSHGGYDPSKDGFMGYD